MTTTMEEAEALWFGPEVSKASYSDRPASSKQNAPSISPAHANLPRAQRTPYRNKLLVLSEPKREDDVPMERGRKPRSPKQDTCVIESRTGSGSGGSGNSSNSDSRRRRSKSETGTRQSSKRTSSNQGAAKASGQPPSPSTLSSGSPPTAARRSSRTRSKSRERRGRRLRRDDFQGTTLRGCVRGTFSAGRHMTECLMVTADIYQQECGTNQKNRGDDAMFLGHEEFSRELVLSFDYDDDDGILDNSITAEKGSVKHSKNTEKGSSAHSSDLVGPPDIMNVAKDDRSPARLTAKTLQGTSVMNGGTQVTDSKEIDEDRPCVERLAFQAEKDVLQQTAAPSPDSPMDYTDLRELRLDLFRQDQDNDTGRVVPVTKYNRALNEIHVHMRATKSLRMELEDMKEQLAGVRDELIKARDEANHRTYAASASGEKLFRERLELEETLRTSMKQNEKLTSRVSHLLDEKNLLSNSLKAEKVKAATSGGTKPNVESSDSTNGHDTDVFGSAVSSESRAPVAHGTMSPHLSTLVIGLRAEIVSLKSELEDTKASLAAAKKGSGVDDTASVKLKEHVLDLKNELDALRIQFDASTRRADEESRRLKAEVSMLRSKLADSEQEVRLHSSKGLKLAEELTETQEEATRLRFQVAQIMKDLDATKKESIESTITGDAEVRKLQEELKSVKDKLARSNADVVEQASDHLTERRQIEEELFHTRQAASILQQRVSLLDGQVALAETEADSLRWKIEQEDNSGRDRGVSGLLKFVNRRLSEDVSEKVLKARLT